MEVINKNNWIETTDGHCRFNWNHEVEPFIDPKDPKQENLIYCRRCDLIFFNRNNKKGCDKKNV